MAKNTGTKSPFKLSIKAGQICPMCEVTKITKDDIEESKMSGFDGCRICFEESGLENEHQDGYHSEDSNSANSACPMCPNYVNPRSEARPALNGCRCGCGAQVKGDYAQGHDAKHVSILVGLAANGLSTVADAVAQLAGSPRLQAKFDRAYTNAQDRIKAKAARADSLAAKKAEREAAQVAKKAAKPVTKKDAKKDAKPVLSFSQVKVGRWSYPVEDVKVDGDQFLVSYTAKDGFTKEATVGLDKLS